MGENVLCKNQMAAFKLVVVNAGRKLDIAHKSGYYNHYHLNDKTSLPHIWFEEPIYIDKDKIRD